MSRKYIDRYFEESDDEDLMLLGSRFMHAVHQQDKREPHRFRQEQDLAGSRTSHHRPRPVRDRG